MDSPARTIERLLTALETLADQEAIHVAAGDHGGILRVQQRATPLVTRLAGIGARSADASAHARVAALLAKRQRSQQLIAAQIARISGELARTRECQQRLATIAPLYIERTKRRLPRRLCAVS